MSVMIIGRESFERIGKYMTLRASEEFAVAELNEWHEVNQRNFAKRYREDYEGPLFDMNEVNFVQVAIPSAVQVVSDLDSLIYNCMDCMSDHLAYGRMVNFRDRIKATEEYRVTRQFKDQVKY